MPTGLECLVSVEHLAIRCKKTQWQAWESTDLNTDGFSTIRLFLKRDEEVFTCWPAYVVQSMILISSTAMKQSHRHPWDSKRNTGNFHFSKCSYTTWWPIATRGSNAQHLVLILIWGPNSSLKHQLVTVQDILYHLSVIRNYICYYVGSWQLKRPAESTAVMSNNSIIAHTFAV